jgi:hypothetical protein
LAGTEQSLNVGLLTTIVGVLGSVLWPIPLKYKDSWRRDERTGEMHIWGTEHGGEIPNVVTPFLVDDGGAEVRTNVSPLSRTTFLPDPRPSRNSARRLGFLKTCSTRSR